MNPRILAIFSWLVTAATPLVLVGLSLRILLTPFFLQLEYNMPYFPADEFGFTKADRLHWAPFALNYLVNKQGINYLAELTFDDGRPLYNERELSHMEDVKNLVQGALFVWYINIFLLAGFGFWAWAGSWFRTYLHGLSRGGWLIVGLAFAIGLIVLIGMTFNPELFWEFFSGFHTLFFEGDSWLFLYTDTLIRLFPIRFWQDAFLLAALLAMGGGLGLGLGFRSR